MLKGAKVIVRFGQGWFLLFGDSGQEVMQNTPLVLRGVTAEEVTDMFRVTFSVHWDWEKKVKMDFQIRGGRIKTVSKITQYRIQMIYEQIFELARRISKFSNMQMI